MMRTSEPAPRGGARRHPDLSSDAPPTAAERLQALLDQSRRRKSRQKPCE
jgi:hypothetical protein